MRLSCRCQGSFLMMPNINIPSQGITENKGRPRENVEQFHVSLLLQNNKLSSLKQYTFIISSFWESWHSLPDFFVSESHTDVIQVLARSVVLFKAQMWKTILPHSHDYWMNLVSCCRTEGFSLLLSTRGSLNSLHSALSFLPRRPGRETTARWAI